MSQPTYITPRTLAESALLFAMMHDKTTFTARDFADFTEIGAFYLDEELANEILLEVVAEGHLREIGPGVYALVKVDGDAPSEQPLWPEEAPA